MNSSGDKISGLDQPKTRRLRWKTRLCLEAVGKTPQAPKRPEPSRRHGLKLVLPVLGAIIDLLFYFRCALCLLCSESFFGPQKREQYHVPDRVLIR